MGIFGRTPDGDSRKLASEYRDEAGKIDVENVDKSGQEKKNNEERAARLREIADSIDPDKKNK